MTHVGSLTVELHLPQAHSLKDKRAVVRPILDGCRHRFAVAAAEVDYQDRWQRSTITVATVSASARHAGEVLDAVERFVWSFPEVSVTRCQRDWLDTEDP
jgi:uncharacterized protein YlxP (DUF503 family)